MKRKHLLSAVLAVLMVISMVTVIVLPTGAEVDLSKIPSVTTATSASSAAQQFKISTCEELIYASNHPTYFSTGDVVYFANDLDCNDYGSSFGADFKNFNPAQDGRTEIRATFDGLGHTIYNFSDDFPFFGGRQVDVIRNLNFDNASVVNNDPSAYAYGILLRSVEFDVLIDNCHIRNSYVYSAYAQYTAIFVPLINNNAGKNLTMVNCTVSNCEVEIGAKDVSATGLFVGRYGSSGTINIQNCMAVNSTISGKVNASTDAGTGFIIGDFNNGSYDERAILKNVGVFDCTHEFPNSDEAATAPILVSKRGSNNQSVIYENIYAAGNILSTDPNSTEDDVPMENLIYHISGDSPFVSHGAAYGGPDEVNAVYFKANPKANVLIPEENIDPTFSMGAAMVLMNKIEAEEEFTPYMDWGIGLENEPVTLEGSFGVPLKITFHGAEEERALYTNIKGGMVSDDVTFQLLRKVSWRDQDQADYLAKNVHWNLLTFNKAMTFTEHDVEIISSGDGYHTTVCHTSDDCVDTVYDIPCKGYAVGTEESGYYGEDAIIYECTVCGYQWKDLISDAVSPAPLTLEYDANSYDVGDKVEITINRASGTDLAGFATLVEFDAALLTYDSFEQLDARYICKVLPLDIGVLSIVMVQKDGMAVNNAGDVLTLNFSAVDYLKDDAESAVTMNVTQAVTKENISSAAVSNSVIQNMLEDNAVIYAAFKAGDVNADGVADLLDVILMMEKLNGSIDEADDEIFVNRAANVDGDENNEINTADITYLLRHLANWTANAELIRSEPNPVVVA